MVPEVGLEPTWALSPPDFESGAYTNFATPAREGSFDDTNSGKGGQGSWGWVFGLWSFVSGLGFFWFSVL